MTVFSVSVSDLANGAICFMVLKRNGNNNAQAPHNRINLLSTAEDGNLHMLSTRLTWLVGLIIGCDIADWPKHGNTSAFIITDQLEYPLHYSVHFRRWASKKNSILPYCMVTLSLNIVLPNCYALYTNWKKYIGYAMPSAFGWWNRFEIPSELVSHSNIPHYLACLSSTKTKVKIKYTTGGYVGWSYATVWQRSVLRNRIAVASQWHARIGPESPLYAISYWFGVLWTLTCFDRLSNSTPISRPGRHSV